MTERNWNDIINNEIRQKYSELERGDDYEAVYKRTLRSSCHDRSGIVFGKEPASIASIAARQHISESYLEQLIAKLRKAGLVTSVRGACGGYVPGRPVEEISVGDVLRALEGNLDPVECPGIQNSSGCDGSDVCVTKYVWQRINDSINRTVDEIKLSELLEESRAVQKKSQIPGSCCEKKE